ncbi:hypothetical protein D7Y11_08640, partial [Corallococcus sp. AB018]
VCPLASKASAMRAHSGFSTCFAMPGSVRREPLPRQSLTAHRWPDGYAHAAPDCEHVVVVHEKNGRPVEDDEYLQRIEAGRENLTIESLVGAVGLLAGHRSSMPCSACDEAHPEGSAVGGM